MRKKTIPLFFLLTAFLSVSAQENNTPSYWTNKGNAGLNLSQSYFSNWAAGGQSAINWLGTLNYSSNYAKDKLTWENSVNLALGYSYFDFDSKPIKTDDKIELTTLGGLKATEKINYSLELALRTQFANGYDYSVDSSTAISKFFAPAYLTLGIGAQWVPNKYFSVNVSPVTGRITIVADQTLADAGAYGVDGSHPDPDNPDKIISGKKARYEFGFRAAAKLEYPIFENVDFQSKLELFSNYLDHPERVDVDWQNLFVMKINSWLNCNLSTHLIYDYDVPFYKTNPQTGEPQLEKNSRVQFKEVLSLGVSVNL